MKTCEMHTDELDSADRSAKFGRREPTKRSLDRDFATKLATPRQYSVVPTMSADAGDILGESVLVSY